MAIQKGIIMSILYKTTRFADTFTGDKETNVRVQLLSWDTLDTKAFVEYLATKYNLSKEKHTKPQHSTGKEWRPY